MISATPAGRRGFRTATLGDVITGQRPKERPLPDGPTAKEKGHGRGKGRHRSATRKRAAPARDGHLQFASDSKRFAVTHQ